MTPRTPPAFDPSQHAGTGPAVAGLHLDRMQHTVGGLPPLTYGSLQKGGIQRQTPRKTERSGLECAPTVTIIDDEPSLAPDMLRGANQIAAFLYGSAAERKKVYHLVKTARLPVFRLGSLLCARRSVLLAWIEEQETRGRTGR